MELKDLLALSVSQQASDLHLQPGSAPILRIHGVLGEIKDHPPLSADESKRLVYSAMTPVQQAKFEHDLILETALFIPEVGNFRVSIYHQLHGTGAVFRVVPDKVPSVDELDLPPIIKNILGFSQGLILVTGPTGSGKSTTMAAMVDYINTFSAHNIVTIEDPIEFIHKNKQSILNQLQVGRDTPDFATALRASLRQDPNVILLGELRDLETMRLALTAAETGHLVLATLHSCSAPLAINRFADVFPSEEKNRVRNLLSETLQAVISQTLVKKMNGGRVAAFEIMLATIAMRHYIRQDMPAHMESTMQVSGGKGMCTMEQSLQELVKRRIINPMTAANALVSRSSFKDSEKE